jgi:predicted nucleotide-binding protein
MDLFRRDDRTLANAFTGAQRSSQRSDFSSSRDHPMGPWQHLDEALDQGTNLLTDSKGIDMDVLSAAYQSWDKRNQIVLESSFTTEGFLAIGPQDDYNNALGLTYPMGPEYSADVTYEGLIDDVKKKMERLKEIRANIEFYPGGQQPAPNSTTLRSDIFIIHGRDDTPRLSVKNLVLEATSHKPIVLKEKVNQGATIIEKLEEFLGEKAGFAVVILTSDDTGSLADDPEIRPRARQNVILELGFAMGRLGRRNVTILYENGVELPSDIAGVAYYELDSGGAWRAGLLGDLKAAGFTVNPEALLG